MPSNEYLNLAMGTYELVVFFKKVYGLGKTSISSKYLYMLFMNLSLKTVFVIQFYLILILYIKHLQTI